MPRPHRAGPSRYLSITLKQQIRSSCALLVSRSARRSGRPTRLLLRVAPLPRRRRLSYDARPGRPDVMRLDFVVLGPGAPVLILTLALLLVYVVASRRVPPREVVLLTRRGCHPSGLGRRAGPASRRSTSCQCATQVFGWVLQQSGFSSRCPGLRLCNARTATALLARSIRTVQLSSTMRTGLLLCAQNCPSALLAYSPSSPFEHDSLVVQYGVQASTGTPRRA